MIGNLPRLRPIVTKPHGQGGRLPAALFVGWLSCDSVDFNAGAATWFEKMLAFERHALELNGTDPAHLDNGIKARERCFFTAKPPLLGAKFSRKTITPSGPILRDPVLGRMIRGLLILTTNVDCAP